MIVARLSSGHGRHLSVSIVIAGLTQETFKCKGGGQQTALDTNAIKLYTSWEAADKLALSTIDKPEMLAEHLGKL